MSDALILTYHSISNGPAPLCVEPEVFARHAEVVAASGATTLTVSALADAIRSGDLPERAVALTFDDGFADTVEVAAPIVAACGIVATVFCVSGYLGRDNDWPTQPAEAPRRRLADAAQLASLVERGWEIGAHGVDHAPLDSLPRAQAVEQLRRSSAALEAVTRSPVRALAFPYGAVPVDAASMLREAGLEAACTTVAAPVAPTCDPLLLPRVDAHYVRSPALLAHVLRGGRAYLALRRAGARARRAVA